MLDGLKTLWGIESMHALPPVLCSAEALRPWVGCNAQQGREGVCQRGAAKRPSERPPGPISPETLANTLVPVFGWKAILLLEARTTIPLAVKVVQIQEHETLFLRALVRQARTNLAGAAHLANVVFDRGFLDGTDLW